ncbi:nickel responsive transcriptional regulator NikR [Methanobrevibacter ruminantium M1]|uniref:Putative nickel-responsive regulator n=2 Tax=Methanobrevibacter ruminantium TaxID=83816 RepID=D3E2X7_METRM|nr:nickel responsive transcriptional regulator NikR [Methanobrevibacter ruminantium M1]
MRISMSLPKKLLAEFDEVLKDRGYQSRSKGIRDALSDYILRYPWMNEMEGNRVGVITVIYDHHFTGVMENLADIQHDCMEEINASMHIHMTHKYCMEVIVVNGNVTHIRELAERMMRLKGVEHVKLTSTANGESLDREPGLEHSHSHSHSHLIFFLKNFFFLFS